MSSSPRAMPTLPRWDPWVLRDGDAYRLFYLGGRTDQDPWWKTSWICGGYAQGWGQWQHTGPLLEPLLEPLAGDGWESGRIFAGSTYKEAGLYYLFYSAASQADIANEAIGLATSTDGVHWQRAERPLLSWKDAVKDAADVRSPSGVGYAGRCNLAGHLHWRDPYVIKSAIKSAGPDEQEKYYLFFCTSLTATKQYQGGLGVAVSDRLRWALSAEAVSLELAVLGWYFKDYRLAIAREFSALWSADGLKIVAN
ncbi:MAG: hypothetical protein WA783_16765 [Phormidesmis sp.]